MKGIYSVAVLFVATLAVSTLSQSQEIPTRCPEIDPKDRTIHLAHKDCTKFYKCFMGKKIEMDCPYMDKDGNRLHFNPRLQVCDWPYRAGCQSKGDDSTTTDSTTTDSTTSTTTPTTTTTTSTTTPEDIITITLTPEVPSSTTTTHKTPTPTPSVPLDCCPKNTGGQVIKVRHETVCNYYYLCIDGIKKQEQCPRETVFNPQIHNCDFPENVDCDSDECGNNFSTFTPTPTPTSKPVPKKCPPKGSGETAKLPHECQCDRYYDCRDGDMILTECPPGLEYDWVREVCDLPSIVKCHRPITESYPSATVSYYELCSSEEEGKKYEHKSSCTAYYECVNNQKVLKYCPRGLHFNYTLQMCEYPNKECVISSSTTETILTTKSTKETCPEHSKERFPHECSCTDYYECVNGFQINRKCPSGQQYDRIRQICDDSEVVKCDQSNPPTKSTTPTIDDDDCSDHESRAKFPHPTDCTRYYQCVWGKKVLKSCMGGFVFNPSLRVCDFPENVKECSSVSKPPAESIASPGSSSCAGKKNGDRVPHEYNCSRYYSCSAGRRILQTCHRHLYFNPAIGVCDLPENVDCRNIVPPIDCPLEGVTRIAHENNCKLYYDCDNGQRSLQRCPRNNNFNPYLKVCDLPENYPCDGDIVVARTTAAYKPSDCIGDCPLKDPSDYTVMLPHVDCHKFCMCSNGVPVEQTCPEDLMYDYVREVCDFPKEVECKVPPQRAFKINGSNEHQNMGKKNDWFNYVKENDDDARKTQENS